MSDRCGLTRKRIAEDGIEASWNDLVSALVRRWPVEYQFVISNLLASRDGVPEIVYCFVRIPPELKGFVIESFGKTVTEIQTCECPKTAARRIFQNLATVFDRLAKME